MKRVIRKFDDFLKSKKVNEDIEPMMTPDTIEQENEEGFESTEDIEDEDTSNLVDSEEDVKISGEEEEEESGEYQGTVLMKQLAEMLGTEVTNNEIDYNGQKIHYYSETEMFHIGKNKFETPQEVVEFLQGKEEVVESKRFAKRHRHTHKRK